MYGKREYGDYQTPEGFSLAVCQYLKEVRKISPSVILEPTCGLGSFIKSSLLFDASEIIGIEINPEYCAACLRNIKDPRVKIIQGNFFDLNLKSLLKDKEQLLIIGNPPWVNNSTLSVLNSANLPQKMNFKELKGIHAITGSSNFDICECIIMQLITSLRNTNTTIAMLCKTSVARNIFAEMKRTHTCFQSCDILEFEANKVFGIHVSACLLVIELQNNANISANVCNVYSFDRPNVVKHSFNYINDSLYGKARKEFGYFSRKCCFEWRQGVKHDCSTIMELSVQGDHFTNNLNEVVRIESDYVFPLMKSSMFKSPVIDHFKKYVIVTQKKLREDTSHIETDAPKTWNYLTSHTEHFSKRKSSIYKNAPLFSMFGIGDYSYSKFKVGISGFYKKPLFSLLVPKEGKPVMTDDTCYFICFPTFNTAYTAMLILNAEIVQNFLSTIAFPDAKRPYTKKILDKIDFHTILQTISITDIVNTEKHLGLKHYFTKEMFEEFQRLPEFNQNLLKLCI